MTETVLFYRVPDDPALLLQMIDGVEAEGSTPLGVMTVREQLWRRGGQAARLSNRLSHNTARLAGGAQ